ncbi:(S)-2-haloacid dehalogenase 1 [Colletotrichum orbiculare MAFF 240422]|uniref:(S)-2-haloacid dehalogenase 1 n=1 Tax=Colletotrichum orbiculare (strain 104-T / ATCC 96160 / CBS 514.97 / LARS 414 / MAFF 240422) TaxID=1213857 RepID=N4UZP3_COLOR|nr:(S)-2-haloacid dehalogenase 1 [Colletotrichum orbiculare MAFF 240422]
MTAPRLKFKAVFFDFMGTCLDWHSSVVQSWPSSVAGEQASRLSLEWRRQYFFENERRFRQGLAPEDIDITLARVLDGVLDEAPEHAAALDAETKSRMVASWHSQPAWPEVRDAIQSVKEDIGLETFVHANGTTRLQLDLTRSSGLGFNMLFSSQLLGLYKPNLDAYKKALDLVKLRAEEVVMVAAHAYDLRAAQQLGMKTIYIHRWTDDIDEDMEKVKVEFDVFLEGMKGLPAAIKQLDSK